MSAVKRQAKNSGAISTVGSYRGVMNWAQRAIAIADRKGLSQTAIGKAVGKSRGWIGKIAAGQSQTPVEEALKVAELLGVSLDFLFRDEMPWAKVGAGGVGNPYDVEASALIKMVDALNIGYDEAIRRIANASEPYRIVAAQVAPPANSEDPGGDPPSGSPGHKPARKGGRIQRDG